MAAYTITRTCGHTTTEQLFGAGAERTRTLTYRKGQPCLSCQRSAQQAAAAESADATGLPALTGSDKQVAWATTIRAEKLAALARLIAQVDAQVAGMGRPLTETEAARAAEWRTAATTITSQTAAAWWIDHRADDARRLLATTGMK